MVALTPRFVKEIMTEKRKVTPFHIEGYLTVGEAAKLIGVTKNTIKKWGDEGKVKMYTFPPNKYRLFKEEDIKELLESIEGTHE
jgi:excisionase family DNA binding protein